MTAVAELAELIVAAEWKRQHRRQKRSARIRKVAADIGFGLFILATIAATAIWIVGVYTTVRLMIGALS